MSEEAAKKDLGDKLTAVFNGLTELRVFTIVDDVPVEISTTQDNRTIATFATVKPDVPALITVFNLIDGDVVNVIAPSLADNAEIRAYHTAQVEKSLAVLPANIQALVGLGKAILDEFT